MISIPELIAQVCAETHEPMIHAAFGSKGIDAVFKIMETAKAFFRAVDPERIQGQIVIFQVVKATEINPIPSGPTSEFATFANRTITELTLEIATDGRPYARSSAGLVLEELAKIAVVYRYANGVDEFLAGSERKVVIRLDASARSQFSVPTLSNLRQALQRYAIENVRESTCHLFETVWADGNRLFLRAGPEKQMRRSLLQFLRNRLGGDHDVWPEQNVNEKNPVDIRVQPKLSSNRLMLIEIKWLGFSIAEDGHITARHLEPQAQKGADQLAEYLDEQRRFAPSSVIHGYYVIIDARRQNLREGVTALPRADGMYFENQEIPFSPAQYEGRSDFDPPYRMFATPICSD